MPNITIHPYEYLEDTGEDDGTGTLTATVEEWRAVVAAIRQGETLSTGAIRFFSDTNKLYADQNNYLSSQYRDQLANYIQSKLSMKILSWNVGIGRKGESWTRESCKNILDNNHDIIFLQEVPQFRNRDEIGADLFFNRAYWKDYRAFTSSRSLPSGKTCEYLLITLVKKKLFGEHFYIHESSISKGCYALTVAPQKNSKLAIVNLHLKADERTKDGSVSCEELRATQANGLGPILNCFDRVISCGDFNCERPEAEILAKKLGVTLNTNLIVTHYWKNKKIKENKQLSYFGSKGVKIENCSCLKPDNIDARTFVGFHFPISGTNDISI